MPFCREAAKGYEQLLLNNIDGNIAIISTHTVQLEEIESNTSQIESNTSQIESNTTH